MNRPLKLEEFRDLIHKGQANDPLVFLESIMSGQDPRKFSGIYKLILEIDSFNDGVIPASDWAEVIDYVITHSKYYPVSVGESSAAAKTLAEYLHAKRKNIEMSGLGLSSGDISSSPLTEEEIELFKEKFNEGF